MSVAASTLPRSRRKSLSYALAAAISAVVHGMFWTLWQSAEREPEQPPPPLIIEATMVAPPHPIVEPPPPTPPKPPEPQPPKPEPTPPEKPKPVPKPKPKPVAKAEPLPKPEASHPEPAPAAPAMVQAAPAPAPVTPAAPPTPAIFNAASLNNPKTSYPPVAQQRSWEGKVLLLVHVLANGTAGQITVQQSSGHEMLDESAMEQVKHWHFIPATRGGKPIESSVVVPVEFKISKH